MAEEDGLLLNFAAGPAISAAPKAREPFKAKTNQRKQNKDKKRKSSDKSTNEGEKENEAENGDRKVNKRAKNDAIDANTFVSSLFSKNAESVQSVAVSDNKQLSPSNAPVHDSVSFESLGIDGRLSSYLTEKLRFQTPTKIQRAVIPSLLKSQRDLFIQAQTGSGKTLSFALPIFHKLVQLSTPISRESGLFAVVLAPSRELALQIYAVFEQLNKRYVKIVPGIVIGGEKKKSEKARLRKGVNILVSTPGRLLDHMNTTKNLNENLSLIRYLVLDEGDKLMELGFEESLASIISKIEAAKNIRQSFFDRTYPELPSKRVNVLCSATIKSNVKKLGEITLNNPQLITAGETSTEKYSSTVEFPDIDDDSSVSVPDQLVQDILVVPPKLRLVSLAGILKNITSGSSGSRTIVFLSCADSVEFHFDVFTRNGKVILSSKGGARNFTKNRRRPVQESHGNPNESRNNPNNIAINNIGNGTNAKPKSDPVEKKQDVPEPDAVHSAMTGPTVNPNTTVYKLSGNMPQHVRTATLQHFSKSLNEKHSILFCTDVVSRGLDLPLISTVIEYDPSFAIDDHLHRVGRTARAGQTGRSVLFLLPGDEEKYIEKLRRFHSSGFHMLTHEKVLKTSFDDKKSEEEKPKKLKGNKWEVEATTWHLNVERWLLEDSGELTKAQQAFVSHIRAYATHLSSERDCFNVKSLHLGHLAKSFGLRETPKKLGHRFNSSKKNGSKDSKKNYEDPKKKLLRAASLAVKQQSSEFNFM